jgi:hypothetical protein
LLDRAALEKPGVGGLVETGESEAVYRGSENSVAGFCLKELKTVLQDLVQYQSTPEHPLFVSMTPHDI